MNYSSIKLSITTLFLAIISTIDLTYFPVFAANKDAVLEDYSTSTITSGLAHPWAAAHLSNGDVLVSERGGSLRVVRNGELLSAKVENVPEVYFAGQGGLLDVFLDANFATNQTLYISYAFGASKANATRLASAKLIPTKESYRLENLKPIFTASPMKKAPQHYSGRIEQMPDGTLLLTVGDGFDYREHAQKLNSHLGKIIRINRDGSVPSDNPFVGTANTKPEIWSYGHRNHQALALVNNVLYQNEHGPKGGDEVNKIVAGQNYGWPIATKGRDYSGARISPFSSYPNTQAPLVDWTPSIAPSSMAAHGNRLYVSSLAEKSIRALTIDGEKITDIGKVFTSIEGRIRDISVGIDGHLYVLTDGDNAELIKVSQTRLK